MQISLPHLKLETAQAITLPSVPHPSGHKSHNSKCSKQQSAFCKARSCDSTIRHVCPVARVIRPCRHLRNQRITLGTSDHRTLWRSEDYKMEIQHPTCGEYMPGCVHVCCPTLIVREVLHCVPVHIQLVSLHYPYVLPRSMVMQCLLLV